MQLDHPSLTFGTGTGQTLLGLLDRRGVERGEQAAGLGPGLLGGVPADDVQADAVVQSAALDVGEAADPRDLVGDGGRRLTPREVGVAELRRDGARGGRGPAEEERRHRIGDALELGVPNLDVFALEVDRAVARPQALDHVEVFAAARVALILVEEVAEGALFVVLSAGDDVEEQASLRLPLEGRGHLRGQRG